MSRQIRRMATAAIALAVLGLAASVADARVARPERTSCTAKFVASAMHLCGPATGKLSVFGSYTFKNGTCKRSVVAGDPAFVLELGALTPGSDTNGGLSYLKIEIYGPLSHPTSGHVISWHNGVRWSGYGQSFKGKASGGTLVATRTASGGGRATGSFQCAR